MESFVTSRRLGPRLNPGLPVLRRTFDGHCVLRLRGRRGEARAGRRARVLAARARLRGDPAGHAARAGAGRRGGAHLAVRRQPRHRDAGVPGRCAAGPVRRDAGAVPGGGLPGAGQVRLPQRRRRRAGAAGAARPDGLLPVPAPDRLRGAGRCRDRRAGGRATRTCRARGHRRDRRQRPVGRRAAASATGSPSSAPGWSAAASHAC